jgi:predicted AlkP superfamily pyrophosphatase or phosphodiesterase
MKVKFLPFIFLVLTALNTSAQQVKSQLQTKSTSLPRPKLVVGIMVDQMRWDYLYRFYERYDNGGFKRMLNEGFSCENAYINYVPSVTGIGHATVYTGSVPAIHGITGNDWIIQATGKEMYCSADSSVSTVGSNSVEAGQMSPKNLLVTSMTDELRLATNFRSKVIAIAAYWYDGSSGNWISSTHYMKQLPAWLTKFNEQKYPEKYLKQDWNTLYPIETYLQSTKDDVPYEGKFPGMSTSTFPVKTSEMMSRGLGLVTSTPFGSSLTLDLAKAAVENETMGTDADTDFLAISVSSPDYIGHQFGPNSIEIEDTYLRLDRDLATFFSYLDTKVGKGNYTVFLTADHAVQHNAGFLNDNKISAGVFPASAVLKELNNQLEAEYKVKNIALSFSNYAVSLNYNAIRTNKLNEELIKKSTMEFLKKQDGVAFVVDIPNAQNATIPEYFKEKIINGYHPDRSGVIQIVLDPAWYSGSSPRSTGATHGTMNPADIHIPMVFMGWGIKQGKSNNSYNMTDIAPTISGILHIQEPNGNIGKAVTEAIK